MVTTGFISIVVGVVTEEILHQSNRVKFDVPFQTALSIFLYFAFWLYVVIGKFRRNPDSIKWLVLLRVFFSNLFLGDPTRSSQRHR